MFVMLLFLDLHFYTVSYRFSKVHPSELQKLHAGVSATNSNISKHEDLRDGGT